MHVYLDDSESFNSEGLVCIAGYAAYDNSWQSFSIEWVKLLKQHNLPPGSPAKYLHVTDFLAGEREYKTLKSLGRQRVEIVNEFITVIREHIEFGVTAAVSSAAYQSATNGIKNRYKPKEFCFERVLRLLMESSATPSDEAISVICDDSSSAGHMLGAFTKLRKKSQNLRDRLGSITFADDRFFQPMQAADLLACITLREQHRTHDAWSNEFGSFGSLLRAPNNFHGIVYLSELWGEEEIVKRSEDIRRAAQPS
ncbi:MAG: DUF3800 domain-containing protein [Thermodesulfobacteriota bacterium]|jgi:hypothetical protein